MSEHSFDLVVIGTGSGGSAVAHKCKKAGRSVAVVDSAPYGGTCALRGCDPKKVLVGAAEVVDSVRRWTGHGVRSAAGIDWSELMAFKTTFVDSVPARRETSFSKAGIETFHGHARFTGPTDLQVGDDTLHAKQVHIATGARLIELGIPGEELLLSSTDFLDLATIPGHVLFVGGGFISFEFAHVAARAGARVTLVHRSQPLKRFDPDLVELLVERTRGLGVDIRLDTPVTAVRAAGSAFEIETGGETIAADAVVHGAGRAPAVANLGLEAAGVEFTARGIQVNEFLQSVSNPSVYSAGDCADTGAPALTPVAAFEARVALANLLEGNHKRLEHPPIPSVVFTIPPLASVGLSEREAYEEDRDVRVTTDQVGGWYSYRRLNEETAAYKVISDKATGRILGAHVLGPGAEELINALMMAMRTGLTVTELKKTIFAYPTFSSDIAYML